MAASVAGALLIFRGVWDAQPLVTFGELPTPGDLRHGRELLAVASVVTVAGGGVLAAARRPLHGTLVALPGPVALALTFVGPANRGPAWVALVLSVVGFAAALRAR